MAKFKPAGSRKTAPVRSNRGLIPCAILILTGFALIMLLFYETLKSGAK
ncbi:MAG TPA: hypothetical protein VNX18_20520 [Bryobacteraceae bacterium]|nr:hypothetical protein [Bryobacteraceae bacterium]